MKNENDTHKKRLLKALRKGPINPLQAWRELGIYRLGARVFDLRGEGHKIKRTMIEVCNTFGETCRVAEYKLIKAATVTRPRHLSTGAGA